MIVISRGLARSFRALARKCSSNRTRGTPLSVVLERKRGRLTLWTRTEDACLVFATPTQSDDETQVVPMDLLEAVEGPGDGPVEIEVGEDLRGTARWTDRGVARSRSFSAILPSKQHESPPSPDDWHPITEDFLSALHECGRTAAREATRFALTRVQLKGRSGQVVGTDGRTALVWGGFKLSFRDELLVPAVPVFHSRELRDDGPPMLGQTEGHLHVAGGPWQVVLPLDREGRYPDVASVVPRRAESVAGIDEVDAAELLDKLPALPGADADDRPVTLALNGWVVVKARDDASSPVAELRLERSPASGPPVNIAVDRRVLARALRLGCFTLRVTPDRPVAFVGEDRTLISVTLPKSATIGGEAEETPMPDTPTPHENHERSKAVKTDNNGHAEGTGPNGRDNTHANDAVDPLEAAEELRAALAEAAARAGRLITSLKAQRKEKKVLKSVWDGLRQLNLTTTYRP